MKKLLSMILTMLMLLSVICVAPVSVGAAQVDVAETAAPETLYLNAGIWDQAGAIFRAWVWGGSTADKWIYFTDSDGDGIYEAALGGTYTGMKILRGAPASTEWSSWNNSGDLSIPTDGKNMYVVTDWSKGNWSTYVAPTPVQPGDASAYYLMGTLTDWSTGQNMVYAEDTGVVTTTVEAAAGTYALKVKKDANWMGASDITLPTSIEGGTISAADVDGNVSLTLTGGTYTFNFTIATKALSIEYTAPEVEPTDAPETDAPATETPATDAPEVDPTETPVVGTKTIYFENNWSWPEVSIYTWGGVAGENATFPGAVMTEIVGKSADGADIYKYEIPADNTGIIFSGEGSYGRDQSNDVNDIKDGYVYYMTWDDVTQSKPCGSYEYTPVVTPDPTEAPATDAPATEAPATETPATDAPEVDPTEAPVVGTKTIYFENNWGWPEVSIYTWGGVAGENATFPGLVMTEIVGQSADGNDIYKMEIPADNTGIIFSGEGSYGRDQSNDVNDIKDGYVYYMTWDDVTQSKPCGSYEYSPVVTPDPTDAPATDAPATEAPATETPEPAEPVSIYFQNNWFWSDVRIHFWGSATVDDTAWPGDSMAEYDNDGTYDYYSYNIPADVEGFLITGIKNDGSGEYDKTPDIKDGWYEFICYAMTWSDGNQVVTFSIGDIDFSGGSNDGGDDDNPTEKEPSLLGTTVTLGGNLGVNFWFDVNDDIVADENAKVLVTLPNGTQLEVPLTELTWVDSDYVYTVEIAAKEMTDVITVQLVATDFATEVYSYTVAYYCYEILSDPEAYAEEQDLVKALLNYGAAAQVYFGYNTDTLANDTEFMTADEKVLANADLSAYAPVFNGEGDVIKYYGASLVLESETALKFYFTVDESVLEEGVMPGIGINGLTSVLEKNGTLYSLKIEDIKAHELDTTYTLSLGNGCTIVYSALSYATIAQHKVEKPALVDVANALAAYSFAAEAYIN